MKLNQPRPRLEIHLSYGGSPARRYCRRRRPKDAKSLVRFPSKSCSAEGEAVESAPGRPNNCSPDTLPVVIVVRRRVRVEMRSEGGVTDGGAGVQSEAEADTVEPVVAVESDSCCVELLDEGVDCATVVAAARASAEPVMGMPKTESKTVSAGGEIDPRPVLQPLAVATEIETRATNVPGGAERLSILVRGSCVRKL